MSEPLEIPFSEFDEYIRQGEPDQREKAGIWSVAIGLQQVDGLHVSKLLLQTALRNIKGEITMDEAQEIIRQHYENKQPQLTEKTSVQTVKTSEKKQKTSVQIIKLLRDNPTYTAETIAQLLGRTTRAIEMQLAKLSQQQIITHDGPNKGGRWIVKEED